MIKQTIKTKTVLGGIPMFLVVLLTTMLGVRSVVEVVYMVFGVFGGWADLQVVALVAGVIALLTAAMTVVLAWLVYLNANHEGNEGKLISILTAVNVYFLVLAILCTLQASMNLVLNYYGNLFAGVWQAIISLFSAVALGGVSEIAKGLRNGMEADERMIAKKSWSIFYIVIAVFTAVVIFINFLTAWAQEQSMEPYALISAFIEIIRYLLLALISLQLGKIADENCVEEAEEPKRKVVLFLPIVAIVLSLAYGVLGFTISPAGSMFDGSFVDNGVVYEYVKEADGMEFYKVTGVIDKSIEKVNVLDSHDGLPVTTIGENSFKECEKMTEVILPNSILTIEKSAFEECKTLVNIQLSSNLTTIEEKAFKYCTYLQISELPQTVTCIGAEAFARCNMVTFSLPGNLKELGSGAFMSCLSMRDMTIPDGVTGELTYTFDNCTHLQTVHIGSGIKTIGDRTFANCYSIKYLVIPKTVTKIEGDNSFRGCYADLYFEGEKSDYEVKEYLWNNFLKDKKIYFAGEWEYVDGIPTPKEK